jgi:hypothetical protein
MVPLHDGLGPLPHALFSPFCVGERLQAGFVREALQNSFKQGCNTSLKRVGNSPHKTELNLYFELGV